MLPIKALKVESIEQQNISIKKLCQSGNYDGKRGEGSGGTTEAGRTFDV